MKRRVVVTGMGAVTPVGIGVKTYWDSLISGRSGIDYITRFDASAFTSRIGGEVRGFDPLDYVDRKEARRMDRFTQLAVVAGIMAVEDARIDFSALDPWRVGIAMGTGIGGIETFVEQYKVLREKGPDRVSPFFIPMMIANMAAGQMAIMFGAKGPNTTVITACAAATNAIGDAFWAIRRGDADVMLAGGSEAPFVELAFAGFCSMKALSTRNDEPQKASRPFDRERDGFVMGEGSAVLVLESLERALDRGARIYAEVAGYGMSADAYHVTAPAPEGEGGARAMKAALVDGDMSPADIDYINAHGTSTPANDKFETMAIKTVFGEHARSLMISSTKSMTGHLLGAAGAIEAVATVMAISEGVVPPTINYEHPDPECDLDYVPNSSRKARVRGALSNSFGFGGQNATVAFRRYEG